MVIENAFDVCRQRPAVSPSKFYERIA